MLIVLILLLYYRDDKLSEILGSRSNATETEVNDPDSEEEEPFQMNLINSTVYIVSMMLQVSTFAVNYRVSTQWYNDVKCLSL